MISSRITPLNRFAVLLGGDPSNTLGGACNRDLAAIFTLLVDNGFSPAQIFVLSQLDDRLLQKTPDVAQRLANTRENIRNTLNSVINMINAKSAQNEETLLVMHYSGHGTQVSDRSGDETDGMDEAIYTNNDIFIDDEFYDGLVLKLPKSCSVFSFWDACHSGSMLDLPFVFDVARNKYVSASRRSDTVDALVYSLSACNDSQCAQQAIGDTCGFGGSLTVAVMDHFGKDFWRLLEQPEDCVKRVLMPFLQQLGQQAMLYCSHINNENKNKE